jgi:hypothetical protein
MYQFTLPADYDNLFSVLGLHSTDIKATSLTYRHLLPISVRSIEMRAVFKFTLGILVGLPFLSATASFTR